MLRTITSLAGKSLVAFVVCYYFAPLSTMNFIHSVTSFIVTDRGQGDTIVRGIE